MPGLRLGLALRRRGHATPPASPANTVLPVVSGNAYVGSTLTSTTGTWTGATPITYAYQWKAGGSNVGSNQSTYVQVTGDLGKTITCTVTATNAGGSASAASAATAAVIAIPVNTVAPATSGNAYVGSTLTASTGTWSGGGSQSFAYQWKSNGSNVGSNQNTYVPVTGDIGHTVTCTVTATNAAGSGTPVASSATAAVIAVPVNTVAPVISGNAYVGSTLTATSGTWSGGGSQTFAYQWKSAGSNVGINQNTYVPVTGDIGNTITCTVTATNAAGSGTPTASSATAAVIGAPANTVLPAISGTATSGQTLSSSTGTWSGGGSISYTYQWKAGGTNIGGATSSTFLLTDTQVGSTITCAVTATNAAGSNTATSSATSAVTVNGTSFDSGTSTNVTLTNGNRTATHGASPSFALARSASFKSTGKLYYEILVSHITSPGDGVGVATAGATPLNVSNDGLNCSVVYQSGNIWSNGVSTGKTLGALADGNRIYVAIDRGNLRAWFSKGGGAWNGDGTANPATNTGGVTMQSADVSPCACFDTANNSQAVIANFGLSAFAGTVPSGFTAGWPV
jgi:hypothetical protein